jgi:cell division protein FtsI (penicillin-binding protein 3)
MSSTKVTSARRVRFRILSIGIALSVVALTGRLVLVQVLDGSRYANYAQAEIEQSVAMPALRGAIYDRSGDLLAASVPRFDVIADDFLITDPDTVASELSPILHVSLSKLIGLLREKHGYVVLARQVSAGTQSAINTLGVNGLSFATDDARVTSGGSIFQPLLGGVNAAGHGNAALEYEFDSLLAGSPGREIVDEVPGGLVLPSGAHQVVAPKPGTSLVLSVDEPLQVEVTKDVTAQMKATHAQSGIAVVTEVHSGAILAMVNLVRVKNQIVPAQSNNAVSSIYQPGSVMKLATISYALQDGLITPNTVFRVPYSIEVGGYTFEDADFHPTENLTVAQILAQSSNVGTIEISRLLGMNRLAQALKAFGFGRLTGVDWPGESPGIVGAPSGWYGSAAASVPIGTGVAVTPMQVLDAYNAVANGGVFVSPHLLSGTITGNSAEKLAPAGATHRVLEPSTVAKLVPMLEGVVQDGTAVLAHIPGYTVAGKTGTAQVPSATGYVPGDWNATFVGFVPAEHPQLSGIVVLNHPTPIYGGTVSAPVFAQIMQYALRHFDIAPPIGSSTVADGAAQPASSTGTPATVTTTASSASGPGGPVVTSPARAPGAGSGGGEPGVGVANGALTNGPASSTSGTAPSGASATAPPNAQR